MLRAGVAVVDITPPIGAVLATVPGWAGEGEQRILGVHDPLRAKALVLADRDTKLAIVTVDQTGLRKDLVAAIRDRVAAATSVAAGNVLVASTHTHSAADQKPPFDEREHPFNTALQERVAGAVIAAAGRLRPVHLEVATGNASPPLYNRRKRVPGGVCTMTCAEGEFAASIERYYHRLGYSGSAEIGVIEDARPPSGPLDPEVTLLSFVDGAGAPLAILANYGCHPTIIRFQDRHISADWVGVATAIMERRFGCPCLFTQSAAGDVRPYYRAPTRSEAVRVGTLIGEAWLVAAGGARRVALGDGPLLAVASLWLELPLREYAVSRSVLEERLTAARARWAELQASAADLATRRRLAEHIQTLELWSPRIEAIVTDEERATGTFGEEVQVMRLGPVGIVGLPGEFFAEFGLALKREQPFPVTIPVSLANQGHNYHPTREAYDEGGYEVMASLLEPGSSERLVEAALGLSAALQAAAAGPS